MAEFQAQIRLPYLEKVHEVINAYLRTSLNGEWVVDPAHSPDAFIMFFRRGQRRWDTYFGFGGRWNEYEYCLSYLIDPPALPVFLKIVIRPSPQSTLLGLNFTTKPVWPASSSRSQELVAKEQDKVKSMLSSIAHSELHGLREYLQEFYSLQDEPELILPISS
jgi:hypothetical protein